MRALGGCQVLPPNAASDAATNTRPSTGHVSGLLPIRRPSTMRAMTNTTVPAAAGQNTNRQNSPCGVTLISYATAPAAPPD